jgi:outer membrane protein TolC
MRPTALSLAVITGLAAAPAAAQTRLTLADAMVRARAESPAARAAASAAQEAAWRVPQARAGYLPRVDAIEAWQRGTHPVFVFSSLLAQRRFTAADFAIDALNHPDPVDNIRSALAVEQSIWDGGLTRLAVERARLDREAADAGRERTGQELALAAAEAYTNVLAADAARRAARAAVEAAEADLARARHRRDAGLATDADVLAVDVHLAEMRAAAIRADADAEVARATLNATIGAPLDATFELDAATPPEVPLDLAALEAAAIQARPEARQAALGVSLAANARRTAQAAFLPQVSFQGVWEANGASYAGQVSSWALGAQVRLNLFRGLADRAHLAEAREAERRQAAERERLEAAIRVEVRAAAARLQAARARAEVGRAALAQARESQRIIRDRYESGLATVTDLLRAAQAVLQAEALAERARVDVIFQSVAVERAVGRL